MACIRCPLEAWDAEGADLFKLIWDRFHIVVPLITMPVRQTPSSSECRCHRADAILLTLGRAPAGRGGLVGAHLGADLQRA